MNALHSTPLSQISVMRLLVESVAETIPTTLTYTVFPRMLTADTISFRRREAANTK